MYVCLCVCVYICRLAELGHHVGYRMIDVLCLKDKSGKHRETRLLNILLYIKTALWKVITLKIEYAECCLSHLFTEIEFFYV